MSDMVEINPFRTIYILTEELVIQLYGPREVCLLDPYTSWHYSFLVEKEHSCSIHDRGGSPFLLEIRGISLN